LDGFLGWAISMMFDDARYLSAAREIGRGDGYSNRWSLCNLTGLANSLRRDVHSAFAAAWLTPEYAGLLK
jgi:hypothetical protein